MSATSHEHLSQQPQRFEYQNKGELRFDWLVKQRLARFSKEVSPLLQPESEFSITRATNVIGFIRETAGKDPEIAKAMEELQTAVVVEIKGEIKDSPEGHYDRAILLLGDAKGRRSAVTVSLYGTAPGISPEEGEEFNPLLHKGHFGGTGVYDLKYPELEKLVLIDALRHADELSHTMNGKAKACGFEFLAGSKNIITDLENIDGEKQAWLNSPAMQYATGMMFSKAGPPPFNGIITGSDAKQTQETIDRMGRGSRLADEGSYNIVGTSMYGFTDTAGYVKYSMEESYKALEQVEYLPTLSEATIAIQGQGKIGSATLDMYLEAGGGKVYVADVLLDKEQTGDALKARKKLENRLKDLRQKYPESEIVVVKSEKIWDQEVDIVSPCSTQERVITRDVINRLGKNGVRVVLSGANNPLENPEIADYALRRYGIIILSEVVTNNGSAITAGMEPRLLYEMSKHKYATIEECKEGLIRRIKQTARTNVNALLQQYERINSIKFENEHISHYRIGQKIFG